MPLLGYIIKKGESYLIESIDYGDNIEACRLKIRMKGGFLATSRAGVSVMSYSPPNSRVKLKWFTNYGYGHRHNTDNYLGVYLNLNLNPSQISIYVKSYDNVVELADLLPFINKYFINPSTELIQELYDIALQKLACYRNVNMTDPNVRIDNHDSGFIERMEASHDLDKKRWSFLLAAHKLKTSIDLYQVEGRLAELNDLEEKRKQIINKIMNAFE